jgi:hypothetical protein
MAQAGSVAKSVVVADSRGAASNRPTRTARHAASRPRPLLVLFHRKRPPRQRQAYLRRMLPIQDRLDDLRCWQRYKPPTRRLLEPLTVRAYAAGNLPNKTRKCHMDTQTRDQTTRLNARLMARSENTKDAHFVYQSVVCSRRARRGGGHACHHTGSALR